MTLEEIIYKIAKAKSIDELQECTSALFSLKDKYPYEILLELSKVILRFGDDIVNERRLKFKSTYENNFKELTNFKKN